MSDYDVIVLGGGSAGTAAAAAAVDAGARTALINDGELGGLCILRGCMPTKAMLASAHAVHEPLHAERFGVQLDGQLVPDFAKIMARKDSLVARFKRAKIAAIESCDYEVIDARGRFVEGGGVEIDGRVLTAGKGYVIATGSQPYAPPIPGLDDVDYLTSDDVMRLTEQPRSMVVQGAGPIGLEMALFFARIGTEVTLVNRSALLSKADADCGRELTAALEEEPNFNLAVPGRIEHVERDGAGLRFRISSDGQEREHKADALLIATGRAAALDGIGLQQAGVTVEQDRVVHDAHMRTTNPNVYVAGDATGSFQILHLANQEGAIAGFNAVHGATREMDYRLRMSVIFTDPPYAEVGLTEKSAASEGREVIVAAARFPETGRAITMETRHGVWKLLADPRTGEILGSSILGPRADDLIHLIAQLMHFHGTIDDIQQLPWYHPTLSEVIMGLERDLRKQRL